MVGQRNQPLSLNFKPGAQVLETLYTMQAQWSVWKASNHLSVSHRTHHQPPVARSLSLQAVDPCVGGHGHTAGTRQPLEELVATVISTEQQPALCKVHAACNSPARRPACCTHCSVQVSRVLQRTHPVTAQGGATVSLWQHASTLLALCFCKFSSCACVAGAFWLGQTT